MMPGGKSKIEGSRQVQHSSMRNQEKNEEEEEEE